MKKDNLFPLDDTAAATLEEKIESYNHLRTAKDKNVAENILTGLTYITRNLDFVLIFWSISEFVIFGKRAIYGSITTICFFL